MPILPVIDLMRGQVVRGLAGRRETYQPIVSHLTTSTRPVDVARALRHHFGFSNLYLADLDAILSGHRDPGAYDALHDEGFRLWVDAGVRTVSDASSLSEVGSVVVGLETVDGSQALREIHDGLGPDRVVFSLDLRNGQPLGN